MAKTIKQIIKELKDLDKRLSTASSDFYTKAEAKIDKELKDPNEYVDAHGRIVDEENAIRTAAQEARQWISTIIPKLEAIADVSCNQMASLSAAKNLESANKWSDSAIKNRIKSNYASIKKNLNNINNGQYGSESSGTGTAGGGGGGGGGGSWGDDDSSSGPLYYDPRSQIGS